MASLYSNENIPLGLVQALRQLGHSVLTSYEAGNANRRITDDELLRFATEQERCVLTYNRKDFKRLHRSTHGEHAGIISCTPRGDVQTSAQKISGIISNLPRLAGQHVAVYVYHHTVT